MDFPLEIIIHKLLIGWMEPKPRWQLNWCHCIIINPPSHHHPLSLFLSLDLFFLVLDLSHLYIILHKYICRRDSKSLVVIFHFSLFQILGQTFFASPCLFVSTTTSYHASIYFAWLSTLCTFLPSLPLHLLFLYLLYKLKGHSCCLYV